MHGLLLTQRRLNLFHPINLLQLALRLRRLTRLRPKPIRKLLQGSNFLLLILIRRQLLLLSRHFLHHILIPIPPIPIQLRMGNLQNRIDQRVEKFSVMRNHQNRPRIRLKIFLKPIKRLQIKVIGRLVKQQQVRLHHQEPRQMRPHNPPPTHRPGLPIKVRLTKCQPLENLFGFRLQLPSP